MKWLTAFLCLLAMPALADSLPRGTIQVPSSLVCGVYNTELADIYKEYGEIPFLKGDTQILTPDISQAYYGDIRIFLDPDDGSYSIFIDIEKELTCLVASGNRIRPDVQGEEL